MRCDGTFSYETKNHNITGSCKFGIVNTYFLPKEKQMNDNYYLHLSSIYMEFGDNSAIYTYDIDDSNMIHHKENINYLNDLKYKRYYQFNIDRNKNSSTIKGNDGIKTVINIHNKKSRPF